MSKTCRDCVWVDECDLTKTKVCKMYEQTHYGRKRENESDSSSSRKD